VVVDQVMVVQVVLTRHSQRHASPEGQKEGQTYNTSDKDYHYDP